MATSTNHYDLDDIVGLEVFVAARHAPRAQIEIGRLLSELGFDHSPGQAIDLATFDTASFTPPHNANWGPTDAWELDDVDYDDDFHRAAMCWAVDNMTDTGRSLLGGMLANPSGIRTKVLADRVGFDGGISGALRHVAGRLRACGLRPVWDGTRSEVGHPDGQTLWIDTEADRYRLCLDVFRARFPEALR